MDFTREPIIETIITPKEGHKLVVRSSKTAGHEEYFVDAVEVVSFGQALFFRSKERPKPFLVPVSDFEVLEVREARMVLKSVGNDRAIKIGGGREQTPRPVKEPVYEREEAPVVVPEEPEGETESTGEPKDGRTDRRRDRRRTQRRRRGKDDLPRGEEEGETTGTPNIPAEEGAAPREDAPVSTGTLFSSLLPPPTVLISETISRYKDNAQFSGAFYTREEKTVPEAEAPASLPFSETEAMDEEEEGSTMPIAQAEPEAQDEGQDKPFDPFYDP